MLSDDEKKKLQKLHEEDKYLRKLKRDDLASNICDIFGPLMLFFAKLFPLTILKNKSISGSLSKSIFDLMASETMLEHQKNKNLIFKNESEAIVEKKLLDSSMRMKSIFKKILFILVFMFFSILIIDNFF